MHAECFFAQMLSWLSDLPNKKSTKIRTQAWQLIQFIRAAATPSLKSRRCHPYRCLARCTQITNASRLICPGLSKCPLLSTIILLKSPSTTQVRSTAIHDPLYSSSVWYGRIHVEYPTGHANMWNPYCPNPLPYYATCTVFLEGHMFVYSHCQLQSFCITPSSWRCDGRWESCTFPMAPRRPTMTFSH